MVAIVLTTDKTAIIHAYIATDDCVAGDIWLLVVDTIRKEFLTVTIAYASIKHINGAAGTRCRGLNDIAGTTGTMLLTANVNRIKNTSGIMMSD